MIQIEYSGNPVEGEMQVTSPGQSPCGHPYYHHEMSHPPGKDPQLPKSLPGSEDDRIS